MKARSEFVLLLEEQMAGLGPVRIKPMFGGYGVFLGDLMFALVSEDRLYFKSDAETDPGFKAIGLGPFVYRSRGREMVMSYREAPPEVFDDPDAMTRWGEGALSAARRALRGHGKRPKGGRGAGSAER